MNEQERIRIFLLPELPAFGSRWQDALKAGYQRKQIVQTIGRRLKSNDRDAKFRQVLLEGKISVNRHKDIELSLG